MSIQELTHFRVHTRKGMSLPTNGKTRTYTNQPTSSASRTRPSCLQNSTIALWFSSARTCNHNEKIKSCKNNIQDSSSFRIYFWKAYYYYLPCWVARIYYNQGPNCDALGPGSLQLFLKLRYFQTPSCSFIKIVWNLQKPKESCIQRSANQQITER